MVKIKITGTKGLQKALEERTSLEPIKQIVKKHTAQLQVKAQQKTTTAYTGHYEGKKFVKPTGATRRSIALMLSGNGMTGTVGMGTYYSPYLELGTRFMAARPVLKPSWEAQRVLFIAELKKIMG
ncbi:HK97-gp10 family putative phage morphogenesis protein [Agrilactobacillus fermenti]|uniref:HK97-gp10 family putative phage morphogenesis protein n=1 Tax=Agrilactobacillus fermenti TaxID=2586909 RepID=UPI001E651CB4|nr:HK97-gp10 family putative phage morphogenesis protein [Agrilactobacillus fermenti]MCD2256413.1 HK97 gp10 family phage protein [Agrilactobacillus fermenti]